MIRHPTDAYQHGQRLALTPCAAEASAFTKAALLLVKAKYREDDYTSYATAVKFNQVLWTLIQSDLSEDPGRFPDDLRSDLLSLSLFVDKQTVKALSEPKAEHLEPLIEIDRNIARGLRAKEKAPG